MACLSCPQPGLSSCWWLLLTSQLGSELSEPVNTASDTGQSSTQHSVGTLQFGWDTCCTALFIWIHCWFCSKMCFASRNSTISFQTVYIQTFCQFRHRESRGGSVAGSVYLLASLSLFEKFCTDLHWHLTTSGPWPSLDVINFWI